MQRNERIAIKLKATTEPVIEILVWLEFWSADQFCCKFGPHAPDQKGCVKMHAFEVSARLDLLAELIFA